MIPIGPRFYRCLENWIRDAWHIRCVWCAGPAMRDGGLCEHCSIHFDLIGIPTRDEYGVAIDTRRWLLVRKEQGDTPTC